MSIKHLLKIDDMPLEEIDDLMRVADILQEVSKRRAICKALDGAVLGALFFEPSTRTRMSFDAAFSRLGGAVISTSGQDSTSMAKGESIKDTAKIISQYVDVVTVRHSDPQFIHEFAAHASVPVINGGNGADEHPTQGLLDIYTIQRALPNRFYSGGLADCKLCIIGDAKYGRTVKSLLKALSLYKGVEVSFYCANGLGPTPDILAMLSARNVKFTICEGMAEAVFGASVIYSTRIQKERFENDTDINFYPDPFTSSFLDSHAADDIILLHPLPRDSRDSAADLYRYVENDPRLKIFEQAANGVAVRMAIFCSVLGVKVDELHLQPITWRAAI